MAQSLAAHIVHLDLEFFPANEFISEITAERNAWYSWRVDWIKEVIGVFRLTTADIATYLDDEISRAGLDSDKHGGKHIRDRCIAFCRTNDF